MYRIDNRMNWLDDEYTKENSILNRVHPLKRKDVLSLLNNIDSGIVSKVILFGSSVTMRCRPWSDLDIYIEYKNGVSKYSISEFVYRLTEVIDSPKDILFKSDIVKRDLILNEINKGVVLYDENIT